MKSVKDQKRDKICLINEEADEDILKINIKRETRIKSCNEEAKQRQLIIKESQTKVESKTKAISKVIAEKITDLISKNQHAIKTMNDIDARIKRIKQDDKTLVKEAPQVLAILDNNVSLIVHQYVSDCLDHIQRQVQKVKFLEGEVGGEHYGRIDGYIGKWELVKSTHIPTIVNKPWVCGLTSKDEICLRDVDTNVTYVNNISTEHTQKVSLVGDSKVSITSCAPIDSNVIVCGKGGRDSTVGSLDGCITLYDRQWKVIRDITIPRNNSTSVYVEVDRDGMILATQYIRSNIYVIDPNDGMIVNNITMQGKVVMGGIQALSSGHIVVKTGDKEFTLISRSGEKKVVMHRDEWCALRCRVDKLTDTLYNTYWDKERNIYAVDQVSCDGIIQARRIVEYENIRQMLLG